MGRRNNGFQMNPFYSDEYVTLYNGDCREILSQIEHGDTCIVDPVWPNSVFPDIESPEALFAEAAALLKVQRLVVHLGCSSDPRFLAGVPTHYPFLRVCWLEYASPSYRGRILIGSLDFPAFFGGQFGAVGRIPGFMLVTSPAAERSRGELVSEMENVPTGLACFLFGVEPVEFPVGFQFAVEFQPGIGQGCAEGVE